jgi:hypothetical protein
MGACSTIFPSRCYALFISFPLLVVNPSLSDCCSNRRTPVVECALPDCASIIEQAIAPVAPGQTCQITCLNLLIGHGSLIYQSHPVSGGFAFTHTAISAFFLKQLDLSPPM